MTAKDMIARAMAAATRRDRPASVQGTVISTSPLTVELDDQPGDILTPQENFCGPAVAGQRILLRREGRRLCVAAIPPHDTGWIAITPAAGFTTSDAAARLKSGVIYLRGIITKSSGDLSGGETIGTLPAAVGLPAVGTPLVWAGPTGAAPMRGFISGGGLLSVTAPLAGAGGYVALSGCVPID